MGEAPPTKGMRELPAWAELERHHAEIGELHLRELFADDPNRGTRFVAEAEGPAARLLQAPDHRRDDRAARAARS